MQKKNTTAATTPPAKKPIVIDKSKTNGETIESNIEELINQTQNNYFNDKHNPNDMKNNIKRIMEKTMRTQIEDNGTGYDLSKLEQVKTMLKKVTDKGFSNLYIKSTYYDYLINNVIQKFFTG